MEKHLVIVESPAKAKTIKKFLGDDYLVKSSFGHVRDLAKKDFGVDVEKQFKPNYIVSADKKKIVSELKKLASSVSVVWLASDEDREGEAISWHLQEVLNLKTENTRRIVFHEITKDAIQNAIASPRSIDMNLVNAQQARRVLDRLVGFNLSPLLWRKIKPSLSAGRVQSVAVRLIVEREREVIAFTPESKYKVTGIFKADNKIIKADLNKKFSEYQEALDFIKLCQQSKYTVQGVQKKPARKSPAPPFTTSTLQQEASRKLRFSVSQTMRVAQSLYESGNITYMRTDSVNLSNLAMGSSANVIKEEYGDKYYKARKYKTKSKGAQEAHEAIRPTYIAKQSISGNKQEQKLYELIWKRTVASQMADAQLEKTIIDIELDNSDFKFVASGEIIRFDGFLKLYIESSDDESVEEMQGILPKFEKGEQLVYNSIEAVQRFTNHLPRFTEASLVKKMEDLGIGRPSTYAPTISTIQNREYVMKEDLEAKLRDIKHIELKSSEVIESVRSEKYGSEHGKLFPTSMGMVVTDFLLTHFKNIMDYNFTASIEKEFDDIATGNVIWSSMIGEFYKPFQKKVDETMSNTEIKKFEKILGNHPENGKPIKVKVGKYGPYVQIGDKDNGDEPKFASLRKEQNIETITLEESLELFRLPRSLGEFQDEEITVAIGKYGPYIKHNKKFYSIKNPDDPYTIEYDRAVEIVEDAIFAAKLFPREFDDVKGLKVMKGRYGPYIVYEEKNYRIPRKVDPITITAQECL